MKRLALTAVVALAMAGIVATTAASESSSQSIPPTCTAQTFRAFSAKVWDVEHWQRGKPGKNSPAIKAQRRRLKCAPPHHRVAMQRIWHRDQAAFFARRGHCLSGPVFAGLVSEFSGGATADGVHVATEPGIALRSSATLGATFRLRTDAGTDYVTQTDWGPADWTGRTIDITSAEMARMGWVPTDSYGEAKLIPPGCL